MPTLARSQCAIRVNFDTYKGCNFDCVYCAEKYRTFRKLHHDKVYPNESERALKNWIHGDRPAWALDLGYKIPIHFGVISDPFPEIEIKERRTFKCLRLLADFGYPVIISTKSKLPACKTYYDLISKCNVVFQISMVSKFYDQYEHAPKFRDRLELMYWMIPIVKRVVIRCQPYIPQVKDDILKMIKCYAFSDVYGLTFESLVWRGSSPLPVSDSDVMKCGYWNRIADNVLYRDYVELREACHDYGLRFLVADDRVMLSGLSDGCCCGVDGLGWI